MTQKEKILKHVNTHGYIDTYTAFRLYGISRLAAVIHTMNESDKAFKTVPHRNIKGAVEYVPDMKERQVSIRFQMYKDVMDASSPRELAGLMLTNLSKLSRTL